MLWPAWCPVPTWAARPRLWVSSRGVGRPALWSPGTERAVPGRQSDVAGGSGGWGGRTWRQLLKPSWDLGQARGLPVCRESVCMRVCARAQVCLPT